MVYEGVMPTTVLLVEDDGAMRLMCRVNLELEGYRVLEADHLARARELIVGERIDVLLLDVHVRCEDGYDLVGLAQENGIPIALMTGSSKVGAPERELVDAVLSKPFKIEELHSTVSRLASARVAR